LAIPSPASPRFLPVSMAQARFFRWAKLPWTTPTMCRTTTASIPLARISWISSSASSPPIPAIDAEQLEKIRQGIRPDMMVQPERVQRSEHQQPQQGRPGFGFPQPRFGMPVPPFPCPQLPVDAAFRAANQLAQCPQALSAPGGDPRKNGAAGCPYGLSRGVFCHGPKEAGYGNRFPSPSTCKHSGCIGVPA
jgi:hypothetical protein